VSGLGPTLRRHLGRWWPVEAALLLSAALLAPLSFAEREGDLTGLSQARRQVAELEPTARRWRAATMRPRELDAELARLDEQLAEIEVLVPRTPAAAREGLLAAVEKAGLRDVTVLAERTEDATGLVRARVHLRVRGHAEGPDGPLGVVRALGRAPLVVQVHSLAVDDLADPASPCTLEVAAHARER